MIRFVFAVGGLSALVFAGLALTSSPTGNAMSPWVLEANSDFSGEWSVEKRDLLGVTSEDETGSVVSLRIGGLEAGTSHVLGTQHFP